MYEDAHSGTWFRGNVWANFILVVVGLGHSKCCYVVKAICKQPNCRASCTCGGGVVVVVDDDRDQLPLGHLESGMSASYARVKYESRRERS